MQRRPCWCCFTQQRSVTLPRSNIQMRVQRACWEGCSHPSRWYRSRAGCGPLFSLSTAYQAQVRRGTPAHFISARCSRAEIPALTLFQSYGLEVSSKYQLLYSKAQELLCSTKGSYLFPCHEEKAQGWKSCTSLPQLHSSVMLASSFTPWTSCLRVTRIVPEQRPLTSIPEDFIQDAIVCLGS